MELVKMCLMMNPKSDRILATFDFDLDCYSYFCTFVYFYLWRQERHSGPNLIYNCMPYIIFYTFVVLQSLLRMIFKHFVPQMACLKF